MRRHSRLGVSVGRSVGVAEHRSSEHRKGIALRRIDLAGFVALVCSAALIMVPAVDAHALSARDRLAAVQRAVDETASRWFAAQNEAAAIDTRIADIQHRIDGSQRRVNATRKVATARAVLMYKTSDVGLTSVFGNDALDSARRAQLADQANEVSQSAIDALTAAVGDLQAQRRDLESQRSHQEKVLRDVAAQRSALDAELAQLRVQARKEAGTALAAARDRAALARARARIRAQLTAIRTDPLASPTLSLSDTAAAPDPTSPPPNDGRVSAHHNDRFLACTRARESNGRYSAVSPAGYYGAYQFLPSTWDSTAVHRGRFDLVGVLPSRASPFDQDEQAWSLYQWQGTGPWGGRC